MRNYRVSAVSRFASSSQARDIPEEEEEEEESEYSSLGSLSGTGYETAVKDRKKMENVSFSR